MIIYIIWALSVKVAIADMYGLLGKYSIKERIPHFTLILLAMLMGYIVQVQRIKIESVDDHLRVIQKRQIENGFEKFASLENEIDPLFQKIFDDKISESFQLIRELIKSKSIVTNDLSRFKHYYKLIIEANPEKEFFAKSISSSNYVWDTSSILKPLEQAMKTHIDNGGKFTRIMFVNNNADNPDVVKKLIEKQIKMGVDLYYIDKNQVSPKLEKNFFYIGNEEFTCEGSLNTKRELIEAKFEINLEKSRNFERYFKLLMSNSSLKKASDYKI